MKTEFTLAQLADPDIAEADKILRACVHCGFCTATCPTYVLLGDELDSPRGRIYLIREMLEKDQPPTPEVVKHIDRCLSCLACMTTCPSGVNYMHLVGPAQQHGVATGGIDACAYQRGLRIRFRRQRRPDQAAAPVVDHVAAGLARQRLAQCAAGGRRADDPPHRPGAEMARGGKRRHIAHRAP